MPEYDEAYNLAQEALAAAEIAVRRVAELESALKVYADGMRFGEFSARKKLLYALRCE
jgi:hypothetical protein